MFVRLQIAACLLVMIAGSLSGAAGDSNNTTANSEGSMAMLSDNTVLARIAAGPGTKVLADNYPGAGSFELLVPSTQPTVIVSLRTEDPKATVTIAGMPVEYDKPSEPLALQSGLNLFDIIVTAEDRKTQAHYQFKVVRAYHTANWQRVVEQAPFVPRDSSGELVFKDRMWIFGGYTPDVIGDIWNSPDGVNWQKTEGNIEGGVNVPAIFSYKGKMWVTTNGGSLYSSQDCKKWDLVLQRVPYGTGFGVVFKDRMWVVGGAAGRQVWSSSDGTNWKLEVDKAPWSQRSMFGNVLTHAGRIWILGGAFGRYQPFKARRDVWSSADGVHWEQVTDQAPWPARWWTCSVEYRNRIWMFGGFRGQPTWQNYNDVWYSVDGKQWRQLNTEDIWSPRHEISGYVFKDSLWVVAGNAWPLVNDIWKLHIPGMIFLSQPVLEEYVGGAYEYRPFADFNESCKPVSYRLLTAPDWLKTDAKTGVVTGTPPAVGDYQVELEAYDAAGETARQAFSVHVVPL